MVNLINAINPINNFDLDHRKCSPGKYKLFDTIDNSLEENKRVMLRGLQLFCMSCRLCPVGCQLISKGDESYDPHVFSTLNFKSRYMVVGQNPGVDECIGGTPFIGNAGKNFNEEIAKNGLSRNDFYITNVVKCFIDDGINNVAETCPETFLANEIKIITPKLIIAIGESPFNFFCPNDTYSDRLGKITKSEFGKIYTIYHPSPINDPMQRKIFNKQIRMLAKLIKTLGV